mmetsp:Transcript_15339/g.19650  ORF Transcript_15339/g.19650 Transcript_15339/m.19650 type:complete len:622 (-) Transcript_15339:260-2125(-)
MNMWTIKHFLALLIAVSNLYKLRTEGFVASRAGQAGLTFFQRAPGVLPLAIEQVKRLRLSAVNFSNKRKQPTWVVSSRDAVIQLLNQEYGLGISQIAEMKSRFPPLSGEMYWKTVEDPESPSNRTKIKTFYDLNSTAPCTLAHLEEGWGLTKEAISTMVMKDPQLISLRKTKLAKARNYLQSTFELSDEELRKAITRAPSILHSDPGSDGVWGRAVQFFEQNLCLNMEEKRKIFLACPQIISLSATKNLEPQMEQICEQYKLSANTYAHMVFKYPQLLIYETGNIIDKMDDLESTLGLKKSETNKLLSACPAVLGRSLEGKIVPLVNYLKNDLRMDKKEVKKVCTSFPEIFGLGMEQKIVPTVKWLKSLGFTKQQIGGVLSKHPGLFGYSLENNLSKKLEFYLDEMQISSDRLSALIQLSPALLAYSLEENLRPKFEFLTERLEIPAADIGKLLKKKPTLLSTKLENYQTNTEFLQSELSLDQPGLRKLITDCPSLLVVTKDVVLEPVISFFVNSVGLSKPALGQASVVFPRLWSYSLESNLKPKIRTFKEEFSADEEAIRKLFTKSPSVFGHSLDNRILPRLNILRQNCVEPGPQHIRAVCKFSDARFSEWIGKKSVLTS